MKITHIVRDHYKMNIACCSSPSSALTGMGVLICDSNGLVVVAFCTSILVNGDVLQAYAQTVLVGLPFALHIGVWRVEVEP